MAVVVCKTDGFDRETPECVETAADLDVLDVDGVVARDHSEEREVVLRELALDRAL